jgi:hopene-associated glycosyltransferase HpnB
MALLIASLSCVIWVYLLTARGGFWRAAQRDDAREAMAAEVSSWPRVVAVIPARDEAEIIGESIASLLQQDYRGDFAVIVVDDHSSDGTAAVARHAATAAAASDRVIVLSAPPLPGGWTGKLWAQHHGVNHARTLPEPPDYLLLTDADIRHAADTLTALVGRAVRDRTVLTSLMASLHCEKLAERAMIPAFIFFFQMLYPFAWVNRANRATAAAAGGCMLVRCQSLQAAGGVEAIRSELIDDCALARLLKSHGPIWLGLTRRVHSVRAYANVGEIRDMIVRSAYAQLRFSPWWLAFTTAAMLVVYVAPPILALLGSGMAQLLGVLAWVLMTLAFQPTLHFYRVSPWWGVALPAIAAWYLVFTLESAYRHMRGRGGEWKGRVHCRVPGQ